MSNQGQDQVLCGTHSSRIYGDLSLSTCADAAGAAELTSSRALQERCNTRGAENEQLKTKSRPRLRRSWDEFFECLMDYKEEHGHTNIPRRFPADPPLGSWVSEQRKKRDELTKSQENRLNAIGFGWDLGPERSARAWDQWLEELKAFRAENGHCRVPKSNVKLGRWVRLQRCSYKQNKLSEDHLARLSELGFDWCLKEVPTLKEKLAKSDEIIWEDEEWRKDVEIFQNCGKNNEASVDAVLDVLRQRLSSREDLLWFEQYKRLVSFFRSQGHCRVITESSRHANIHPQHELGVDVRLANWVRTQRRAYRSCQLLPHRQQLLEAIRFPWLSDHAPFHEKILEVPKEVYLERLLNYKRHTGHVNIPDPPSVNVQLDNWLGHWLSHQRHLGREGLLEVKCALQLLNLGVIWGGADEPFDLQWERMFWQCKGFFESSGDYDILRQNVSMELFVWVESQRFQYTKSLISEQRRKRLQAIRFPFVSDQRNVTVGSIIAAAASKAFSHQEDEAKQEIRQTAAKSDWDEEKAHSDKYKHGATKWDSEEDDAVSDESKQGAFKNDQDEHHTDSEQSKQGTARNSWGYEDDVTVYQSDDGEHKAGTKQKAENYSSEISAGDKRKRQEFDHVSRKTAQKSPLDSDIDDKDCRSFNHEVKEGYSCYTAGSRRTRDWDQYYECLVHYTKVYGNSNVPKRFSLDLSLGHWVCMQRKDKEALTQEQRDKLMGLNFYWYTQQERDLRAWEDRFMELQAYKQKHGHCRVPDRYQSLGRWVRMQRTKWKKAILSPDHYAKLSSIGFEWEVQGNLKIKKDCSRGETTLSPEQYERLKYIQDEHGVIDLDYILEAIKDQESPSRENKRWLCQFEKLVEYYKMNGNTMVPYGSLDATLSNWVSTQRKYFRSCCLPEQRKMLLNALGFVWKFEESDRSQKKRWEESFKKLQDFHKKNGHVNIHLNHVGFDADNGLGSWLVRQTKNGQNGILEPTFARQLAGIGVAWADDFDLSWEGKLFELRSFHAKFGNYLITMSTVPTKLDAWVKQQRELFYSGALSGERKERLDSVGFPWRTRTSRATIPQGC